MPTLEAWVTGVDEEQGTLELSCEQPAQRLTLSLGLWRGPLPLLLPGVEVTCTLEEPITSEAAIEPTQVKTVAPLRRDARFARQLGTGLLCQGHDLKALAAATELAHLEPAAAVGQTVSLVRRQNPRVPGEFLAIGIRSAVVVELEGVLNNWNARGFGIVDVAGKGTYLLLATEVLDGATPVRGSRIRFQPRERPGARGPSATRARVVGAPVLRPPRTSAAPPPRELLKVNPAVRVQGTVTSWVQHDDKAYGIVREANSLNTLTFVPSSIRPGSATPEVGRRVEFCHAHHPQSPGVLVAADIVVFADEATSTGVCSSELLGASTHRATSHALNEDAFLVLELDGGVLLAVADGTSMPVDTGWWSSDTALDLLWQLVKDSSLQALDAVRPADRGAVLERLLRDVQARYLEVRGRQASKFRGACTTLAVAVIGDDGWLHAASAGDSRVLLDDPASQSFRDLDWQGRRPPEGPSGQLASAVGYPVLDLHAATARLAPGRMVALATDGVSFARTHASSGVYRLAQTAESLPAAAEAATLESVHVGNDDATLILFKYGPAHPKG